MKTGRTLQELATELKRQRESMRDFKAPTRKVVYGANNTVDLLDSNGMKPTDLHFDSNDLFMRQLTGWADIPKKYVDRMAAEAPELLTRNINHWLTQSDETRLIRTLDGNARAFLSHRYRIIDNIGVLETIIPVFGEHHVETVSQEVTDTHLYVKALNRRKTYEVKKGDQVQFGVVVSNSEVGLGAVHADPLIYTLACENGMIMAASGLRKFHIGKRLAELDETAEVFKDDTVEADNKAFFLKLRDIVNAAFDETQMTEVLKAVQEGTTRKLTDAVALTDVMEVTSVKYGLNGTETEGVLKRLIEGGDLTQWGLSSAITLYAQQPESYQRATELEKIGGEVAVLDEHEWKEIAK